MTSIKDLEGRFLKRFHRVMEERWQGGDAFWREVINRRACRLHQRKPLPVSTPLAHRVLRELSTDGVTTFHASTLTDGQSLLQEISEQEQRLVEAHTQTVEERRATFQENRVCSKERYLLFFQPAEEDSTLPFSDPTVRFALHPEILGVVNMFLGLYAELRRLEFWYTLASHHQVPSHSQLWHRNFEDVSLIKVFLYLSDVDEKSGPFSFVRGTHHGPLRWRDPEEVAAKRTNRANDSEIAALVPRESWFVGTGLKGTVIMAATKGYYKGGFAIQHDRRLLTATYLSPWCSNSHLAKPITGVLRTVHPAIRFAAQRKMAPGVLIHIIHSFGNSRCGC